MNRNRRIEGFRSFMVKSKLAWKREKVIKAFFRVSQLFLQKKYYMGVRDLISSFIWHFFLCTWNDDHKGIIQAFEMACQDRSKRKSPCRHPGLFRFSRHFVASFYTRRWRTRSPWYCTKFWKTKTRTMKSTRAEFFKKNENITLIWRPFLLPQWKTWGWNSRKPLCPSICYLARCIRSSSSTWTRFAAGTCYYPEWIPKTSLAPAKD